MSLLGHRKFAHKILSCLQSFALLPTSDKPTHIDSATQIDNIFINEIDDYFSSGNVDYGITDHFPQCLIKHSFCQLIQPPKILLRDYSKFSEEIFLQELSQFKWEMLLSGDDINIIIIIFLLSITN